MILEAKKVRFIIETANIEETTQKETDEIIERLNKYNDDELEITDIKEKFKNNIILHFKDKKYRYKKTNRI